MQALTVTDQILARIECLLPGLKSLVPLKAHLHPWEVSQVELAI